MLKVNWTLSAILMAVPFSAFAQQPYHGTFRLPVEAHFGSVVLQPGEYTVSTVEVPTGVKAVRFAGAHATATILAASVDPHSGAERGKLTLSNINGVYALTRLETGLMGKSFDFEVAKDIRNNVERAATPSDKLQVAMK